MKSLVRPTAERSRRRRRRNRRACLIFDDGRRGVKIK